MCEQPLDLSLDEPRTSNEIGTLGPPCALKWTANSCFIDAVLSATLLTSNYSPLHVYVSLDLNLCKVRGKHILHYPDLARVVNVIQKELRRLTTCLNRHVSCTTTFLRYLLASYCKQYIVIFGNQTTDIFTQNWERDIADPLQLLELFKIIFESCSDNTTVWKEIETIACACQEQACLLPGNCNENVKDAPPKELLSELESYRVMESFTKLSRTMYATDRCQLIEKNIHEVNKEVKSDFKDRRQILMLRSPDVSVSLFDIPDDFVLDLELVFPKMKHVTRRWPWHSCYRVELAVPERSHYLVFSVYRQGLNSSTSEVAVRFPLQLHIDPPSTPLYLESIILCIGRHYVSLTRRPDGKDFSYIDDMQQHTVIVTDPTVEFVQRHCVFLLYSMQKLGNPRRRLPPVDLPAE